MICVAHHYSYPTRVYSLKNLQTIQQMHKKKISQNEKVSEARSYSTKGHCEFFKPSHRFIPAAAAPEAS